MLVLRETKRATFRSFRSVGFLVGLKGNSKESHRVGGPHTHWACPKPAGTSEALSGFPSHFPFKETCGDFNWSPQQ